jgi:hypothetical protein
MIADLLPPVEEATLPPAAVYPGVPKGATDLIRLEYANQGKEDLYFLCRAILGYDRLTPHTHGHLCHFITTCDSIRRMIQMPRSHFKTTIATIGDSIRLAVCDPNIQILIVASSSTNAERFLMEITNHFKRNECFRWAFRELIPEDWSKVTNNRQELEINRTSFSRDPTFDTIGARGAVESRHYHRIKADDIIGLKERQSETEMLATCEWSDGLESLLIMPEEDTIDYIGTRQAQNDVYAHQERYYGRNKTPVPVGPYVTKHGELYKFNRGAEEDGEPIFPEMITKERLNNLRIANPERYAAHYANDPRQSGLNIFGEENLRLWEYRSGSIVLIDPVDGELEVGPPNSLELITLCDPAQAKDRKKHARQALILTGTAMIGSKLRIITIKTAIGHYPADELVNTIFEWDSRYEIAYFSIEKFGFQGSLERWIHEKATRERVPEPAVMLWPPKGTHLAQKSKDERIRGLQPLWNAGQLYFHKEQSELIEEALDWPNSRFRDGLDALAQGVILWETSWDEKEEQESRDREDEYLSKLGVTGYSVRKAS